MTNQEREYVESYRSDSGCFAIIIYLLVIIAAIILLISIF